MFKNDYGDDSGYQQLQLQLQLQMQMQMQLQMQQQQTGAQNQSHLTSSHPQAEINYRHVPFTQQHSLLSTVPLQNTGYRQDYGYQFNNSNNAAGEADVIPLSNNFANDDYQHLISHQYQNSKINNNIPNSSYHNNNNSLHPNFHPHHNLHSRQSLVQDISHSQPLPTDSQNLTPSVSNPAILSNYGNHESISRGNETPYNTKSMLPNQVSNVNTLPLHSTSNGDFPILQTKSSGSDTLKNQNHKDSKLKSSSPQYTQFVTTLIDSTTNKLVQVTSKPPADYVPSKKRRNRMTISCLSCKKRKVKCDRERPVCGSCKKHGFLSCVYSSNDEEKEDFNKIKKLEKEKQSTNEEYCNIDNRSSVNQVTTKEFNSLLMRLDNIKTEHMCENEIEKLRQSLEQLKFYLDDKNVLNSKSLRNLKTIIKLDLLPVLNPNYSSQPNVYDFGNGVSSMTSYIEGDKVMGKFFKKNINKISYDMVQWKAKFSVEIYKNAIDKILMSKKKTASTLEDAKFDKINSIYRLIEDYFINYDTFTKFLNNSVKIMLISLPVASKKLINKLTNDHFIKSELDGKLKIINSDSADDIFEILLVLAIIRYGLPQSENVMIAPDHVNHENLFKIENIYSNFKTDILMSLLKIILNELDLSRKYSIPILGILIIFFMISYTNRFNFKSDSMETGLNYGVMAIYMAINLGVYSNLNQINDKSVKKYLSYFSNDEFHNIWNLCVFIDTFSSFNSGLPQLIGTNLDTIHATSFVNQNGVDICSFNRKAYRLASKDNLNGQSVSIVRYERFVIEFENYLINNLNLTSEYFENNDLVGAATSIRALNLLLFLYYNSYHSLNKSYETYTHEKPSSMNEKLLKEFKELNKRLFQRSIKLSILLLINLNKIIVLSFTSKTATFYEKYSFDLIQGMIKTIYMLSSHTCQIIDTNKKNGISFKDDYNNANNFNFLYDLSLEETGLLLKYFVFSQCCSSTSGAEEVIKSKYDEKILNLHAQIDLLSTNPNALTKLLVGFFFNTSKSIIAQNFMYYMIYKYCVMSTKCFLESSTNAEDFTLDAFETQNPNMDCTWFIND